MRKCVLRGAGESSVRQLGPGTCRRIAANRLFRLFGLCRKKRLIFFDFFL